MTIGPLFPVLSLQTKHFLKQHRNTLDTQSDKGNLTVIMNNNQEIDLANNLISNSSSFDEVE